MKRWKRLIYYLLINIAVSACTVILVLSVWERNFRPVVETPPPIIVAPTATIDGATPTNLPQSTEASEPSPTPALGSYQILPGDTLAVIAAEKGTTVEILVALNNLVDPNNLVVGEILLIPSQTESADVIASASATIEAAPEPTRTPPPTFPPGNTPTAIPSGIQIPINIVTVIGAGVLEDERVVIRYNGEGELALHNWQLEDDSGNLYIFPQLSLFKDGAISVSTRPGVDTVVELFWGLEGPVWEAGEIVVLRDSQGNTQATGRVP